MSTVNSKFHWKQFWEQKNSSTASDYEVDRGAPPRESEIERLSIEESFAFIGADPSELVFDAGCENRG